MEEQKNIIIYKSKDGQTQIDVTLEKDTVWLTQAQIALLFYTTKQNISLHLQNIFKTDELHENSVVEESSITASDEKRYKTQFYKEELMRT